jgi:diacylglycerol kinase family enzyme
MAARGVFMAKAYILYNSLAGNGKGAEAISHLDTHIDDEKVLCDMTKGYRHIFDGLSDGDYIVLCGGDGTLNRFINETADIEFDNDVLYFACGSGNDFARDLGHDSLDKPYSIKKYLCDLPTVEVNGKNYRFLNGVGYGIDGYCCEVGDKLRAIPGKKVDYTAIAIKGLLFHYKPTNARITVDGVEHTYKKVWLAPTMHGGRYGGGMMPTPMQSRENGFGKLSTLVFHGSGKIRTLIMFPLIFKGEHIKYTKNVEVLEGHEIKVEFDRPTALQIDGETVLGVTSYTACGKVLAKV